VLLNATAIDVEGNNLFNLIEIGNPGWIAKYANRAVYGLCQNKIQNFVNMSFDGGYIPGTNPYPLGWSVDPTNGGGGALINSSAFGNAYYIENTTDSTVEYLGLITQSAFQDYYQVPIININTTYSVRVTARIPSGNTVGNLVINLAEYNIGTQFGGTYGSYIIPFSEMSTELAIFAGPLLTTAFATTSAVPSGLVLRVYAQDIGAGADVEIDRIEVFPTEIPVLNTQVFMSYVENFESVDGVTGVVGVNAQNNQPIMNSQELDGVLYFLKEKSWYGTQDTPNTEPAYWNTAQVVSQKAGSCGINASDQGEGWIISACRAGLFVFVGGPPKKINHEIYQIWDAINWSAGNSIWVRNDSTKRKLYVGVPLPTPNFWLPDAPSNPAPTTPNVILMCNYQGIDSGEELQVGMQMHSTMFGNLMSVDMKRKWSIWQVPCPYADFVKRDELDEELLLCNGIGSSKIYRLAPNVTGVVPTDDGAPITSLYVTYGWNSAQKVRGNPLMGAGRIRWGYGQFLCSGVGTLNLRMLPNVLLGPTDSTANYYPWTVPGGFVLTDPSTYPREFTCNFPAMWMYLEFSTSGAFDLSWAGMTGAKDVFNQVRGIK
jgi:hypothetical protein